MPRQLWLADAARHAGLTVREASGWRTRGSADFAPRGVVAHHTATPPSWSRTQLTNLLVRGHAALSGPLAHYQLDRDGTVTVIAAGRANHAGRGGWGGLVGNRSVIGIEAANDGVGEPWPAVQVDAYDRLAAAVLDRLGQPAAMLAGHKEWAPSRKIDPRGIDMAAMRARVDRLLTPPDPLEEWYMSLTPARRRTLDRLLDEVNVDQLTDLLRRLGAADRRFLGEFATAARGAGDTAVDGTRAGRDLNQLSRHVDTAGSSVQGVVYGALSAVDAVRDLGYVVDPARGRHGVERDDRR